MKIPELSDNLSIISQLGDNPGTDDGLSAEALKAKFDEAALAIQRYINGTLLPAVSAIKSSIVVSSTKPDLAGVLWFDTSRGTAASGIALLSLDEDETGAAVMADVDGETYGVENATVNAGASGSNYDFTVL